MRGLSRGFRRRGVGNVSILTLLVIIIGAAGMYRFELDAPNGPGFTDYTSALWWTAMLLTTMGSEYWPKTAEGRMLCLVLALYAFAVFGYVTASLAAFFIDADKTGMPGVASQKQFRLAALTIPLRPEPISRRSRSLDPERWKR